MARRRTQPEPPVADPRLPSAVLTRGLRRSLVAAPASVLVMVAMHGCGSDRPPAGSDGSTSPVDNIAAGPCAPDGSTRACHAIVAQHKGVVDCFNATQTCTGGVWGPCGGDDGTATLSTHAVAGAGLHIASLTDAGSTGSPCSSDPCNPGCVGYNENPPTPVYAGCGGGGFLIGNVPFNSLDGDLTEKMPGQDSGPATCIADQTGCAGLSLNAVIDNSTKCDDCNFDMHCVAGACVPWILNGNAASFPADCASGIDYTLEFPCKTGPGSGTDYHLTVCNRGTTLANAVGKLKIGVFDKDQINRCVDPKGAGSCSPAGPATLNCPKGDVWVEATMGPGVSDIALAPGQCVEINSSNSVVRKKDGTLDTAANFDSQISDPSALFVNWDGSLPECNRCNNANGWQNGVACTSVGTTSAVYKQTYQGICPAGYMPQWGTLAYNVTTPTGSDVKFGVNAGPTNTGPWTPAAPVQVAEAAPTPPPADHPNNCSMTGPSPCGGAYPASCKCPIDLYPPLTSPGPLTPANANQSYLQLSVTMDSTSFGCFASVPTTTTGTSSGCSGGQDVNGGACAAATQYTDCQQDFHCDVGGTNQCIWNQPHAVPAPVVGPNWFDPNCKFAGGVPGVDLTVGYPCGSTVPLCNRGGGTLAPTSIKFNISNSGVSWDCGAAPSATTAPGSLDCTFAMTAPLGPGQCVAVDATSCPGMSFGTGQRRIYVNADLAVHECGMQVADTGGGGCRNNTTAIKATGGGCPPACQAPGSVTQPALNNWKVEYTCVANE